MQQRFVGRVKSIAGTALIGLGVFVFYENLHQAATQLSHLLAIPREALGVVPTVILAASRVLQAYGTNPPDLCRVAFCTCWHHPGRCYSSSSEWYCRGIAPLTMLNAPPKKDCGLVDLTAARSTSE